MQLFTGHTVRYTLARLYEFQWSVMQGACRPALLSSAEAQEHLKDFQDFAQDSGLEAQMLTAQGDAK